MCVYMYIYMTTLHSSPIPKRETLQRFVSAMAIPPSLQANLHSVAHLFPQGPFLALLQAPGAQGQGRILRDQGILQLLQRVPGNV